MNQLIPLELKGQRILTTQQLAEFYEAEPRKITDNFNNNRNRYQEGKHYFLLQDEELKKFKGENENFGVASNINKLYLWTETGAFLHAKSLNTDKAWEVYGVLVETYFRVKEQKPTCIEDVLIQSLQEMKDMRQQLNEVNNHVLEASAKVEENKQEIQGIRDVITLNPNSWRADTTAIINAIAKELGGYEHIGPVREESYKLLDERAGAKLSIRLTNRRRKVLEETGSKSKANKVSKLDVIADDKRLTEVYIAIIKEMAIKNGIEKGA